MNELQYSLLRKIYKDEYKLTEAYITGKDLHKLIFGKYFIELAAVGINHQEAVDLLHKWISRGYSRTIKSKTLHVTPLKERWDARVAKLVTRCARGMDYIKKLQCYELDFEIIRAGFVSISCISPLVTLRSVVTLTVPYDWYTEIYKADKALYISPECGRCLRLSHDKYLGAKPGLLYIGTIT